MKITAVALLLVWIAFTPGCSQGGDFSATAPSSRGVLFSDPLPRLIDNLPGENHFANVIQLTDGGANRQPRWSPTGQELAFWSVRPPHSTSERYVMAIDSSGLSQISGDQAAAVEEARRWAQEQPTEKGGSPSPDGSRVCFHGYQDEISLDDSVKRYLGSIPVSGEGPDHLNLYISNIDGSGVTEVLSNGTINGSPCFAPDGKHLIFSSNLGGKGFNLYSISLDGMVLEKITASAGFDGDPAFSPDGRRLVFISQRNDEDPQEFNVFVADWLVIE